LANEENKDPVIVPDAALALENDDITDYIQDKSFDDLVKRFGTADEDESIRNEDFNPLVMGKVSKKNEQDEFRSAPSFKADPITSVATISTKSAFGTAQSEFDNDAVSFDDIDIGSLGDIVNAEEEKAENAAESDPTYNTNTRVVYLNESADDGIKRNTDLEVSSVFTPDE